MFSYFPLLSYYQAHNLFPLEFESKETFSKRKGTVSPIEAGCIAIGGAVGCTAIGGVATAVATGGPGQFSGCGYGQYLV